MICDRTCPDWRLRCILFACPELSEILDRIDKDIDYQRERIRAEMDERIERYLGRRRI
jgi:hypothetical protein